MDTDLDDGTKSKQVITDIPTDEATIKAQEVENIVRADREAFEAWITDPQNAMRLDSLLLHSDIY